jgi:hypothetical protein
MFVCCLFLIQFLFDILLCVVLKGHKSLFYIQTKLHAELHTILCVQSWQSMVGTGTKCWCIVIFFVYFHLYIALCLVLKGHKSLFYIQTKLHVMLSYYSVCAVLAEYGWYRYYMLVHSDFFVYFHLFTLLCVVLKGSKPLPSIGTKQHA